MTPFINLFRRYLREQGLPVTQQREAVADIVFSSTGHLSVEDIEAALKGQGERIGKATIYRTMEILVRSGLVVLALMGEEDVPSDQREVVTVQYELRSGKGAPPPVRELTPRGWAPADRVPAMIDGVVRRLGGAEQEPRSATIRGEVERWNRFVDEVSDGKVDLANGE